MGCPNKDKNTSLYYKFIRGGLAYGSLCIPDIFLDLILIIIFPPIFVIYYQIKQKKMDIGQILLNFVLML